MLRKHRPERQLLTRTAHAFDVSQLTGSRQIYADLHGAFHARRQRCFSANKCCRSSPGTRRPGRSRRGSGSGACPSPLSTGNPAGPGGAAAPEREARRDRRTPRGWVRSAAAGGLRRRLAAGRGARRGGELRPAPALPPRGVAAALKGAGGAGAGCSGERRGRLGPELPLAGAPPARRGAGVSARPGPPGAAAAAPGGGAPLPPQVRGGAGSPRLPPSVPGRQEQPGSGLGPRLAPRAPPGPGRTEPSAPGPPKPWRPGRARHPSWQLPAEPARLLAPSPPRCRAPAARGPEARSVAAAVPRARRSAAAPPPRPVRVVPLLGARPSCAGKPLPSSLSPQGGGRRGLRRSGS